MFRSPLAWILLASTVLFGLGALLTGAPGGDLEDSRGDSAVSVTEVLRGGDRDGFVRVEGPRELVFPRDHGPHPETQIEWWYTTGNLATAAGRRFGFELTFFRIGLAPPRPDHQAPDSQASAWRSTELYMAHFALTDAATETFRSAERFSRGALGLAGASAEPFVVWTETWRLASTGEKFFPLELRAAAADLAVDLTLTTQKPKVLQGDRGYSRKGSEPGNASHYVSFTRLSATGTVATDDESHEVSGRAWLDHEWSTSSLDTGVVGWDWFALQLDDDTELMVYGLRLDGGGLGPHSEGIVVDRDGRVRRLRREDFELTVTGHWDSPATGARYPSRWTIDVPGEQLIVQVIPVIADQELHHTTVYWEGAVDVVGERAGRSVTGQGYVELVGYSGEDSAGP